MYRVSQIASDADSALGSRVPLMSSFVPEHSSLVYPEDDDFIMMVGEPIELTRVSRIVVAKWDGFYADALRITCGRAFPDVPIEICRSGRAALQALRQRPADFLLLGLSFADIDGIDILEANAREGLARRIFIVSSRKDDHTLRALRLARFDGFLDPIEEGESALVQALRQVADGRGYISAALCRRFVERRAESALTQRLSFAELMVFSLIGDGTDDAEAAQQLALSTTTVQSHRRNLMRKLEVATSARLVREAVRLGVVRIGPDGDVVRPGFERMFAEWRARKGVKPDPA